MKRLSVPLITRALWAGVIALGVVFVSAALVLDFEGARDEPLVTVLVATRLMAKGTPGNRIVVGEMYARTTVRRSQVEDGAIADPEYLCGRVMATDVFPGQQLTAESFRREEQKSFGHSSPRMPCPRVKMVREHFGEDDPGVASVLR